MELGVEAAPAPATASQASRAARSAIDMVRIRRVAAGGATVEKLLAAAFGAIAKATANHAAEWLPAGLIATNGSTTVEGKLCTARITPELRAKYDALCATSTPVERLHALGRCVDDRSKRQRVDTRAGVQLGIVNGQGAHLAAMETEQLEMTFNISRRAARRARKQTIKQQLIAAGRAKRAARDAKFSSKRARREAKAAEKARLEKVTLATTYSELKVMAIPELQDQLKAIKLQGTTKLKFTVSQKNRISYCAQRQALLLEACGEQANDLVGADSGCDGDGVTRKVRACEGGGSSSGPKRKGWNQLNGYWRQDSETFDIERLLDKKVERRPVGKGKKKSTKEFLFYKVMWEGFPPEFASWEPESEIHDDFIDEFEAALEAEAELEAEEEDEEDENSMEDE